MPEKAELELHTVQGCEIKLRWKLDRHGEWIAWCYVPGSQGLFNEGVGFEGRAATAEEAKQAVLDKVRAHLG